MRSSARRLLAGGVMLALTAVGILLLLDTNDRLTGPTSQELIDQLVSTNPRSTGDWAEKRPATWSDTEDERVQRMIARLESDPRRHMDALVANINQREFSTTMSTAVPYSAIDVGTICKQIIEYHFYRYCPRGAYDDGDRNTKRSYRSYFDTMDKHRLTIWWAENRGKSNREIGNLIADWHRAERAVKRPQ